IREGCIFHDRVGLATGEWQACDRVPGQIQDTGTDRHGQTECTVARARVDGHGIATPRTSYLSNACTLNLPCHSQTEIGCSDALNEFVKIHSEVHSTSVCCRRRCTLKVGHRWCGRVQRLHFVFIRPNITMASLWTCNPAL